MCIELINIFLKTLNFLIFFEIDYHPRLALTSRLMFEFILINIIVNFDFLLIRKRIYAFYN